MPEILKRFLEGLFAHFPVGTQALKNLPVFNLWGFSHSFHWALVLELYSLDRYLTMHSQLWMHTICHFSLFNLFSYFTTCNTG